VTATEECQIAPRRRIVPEALDLYLPGRQAAHQRTESGLRRGLALYKQALEIDPTDPAIHVGIAEAYILLAAFGFLPAIESLERARAASLAALHLEPASAAARCALAAIITPLEWNRTAAEAAYREAIALSPGYSLAYHWYAELLTSCRRFDEALAAAEKARDLDPLSAVLGVLPAWIRYFAREYDRAIGLARRAVNLDPDFSFAHFVLGLALEGKGDAARAVGSFEHAVRLSPGAGDYEAALGHACARSGDEAGARSLLATLEASSSERFVSPFALALVALGLGDHERALRLLERGAEERAHDLYFLAVDPRLDPLRDEPRFVALEKRICG
jgi:tetratricopeptide (TPR) repeat protein